MALTRSQTAFALGYCASVLEFVIPWPPWALVDDTLLLIDSKELVILSTYSLDAIAANAYGEKKTWAASAKPTKNEILLLITVKPSNRFDFTINREMNQNKNPTAM